MMVGDMNKDVVAAALRLDEAVTLGRIEPFRGTCRHLSCFNRRSGFLEHRTSTELTVELRIVVLVVVDIVVLGVIGSNPPTATREVS
jgi:hypothetical protein